MELRKPMAMAPCICKYQLQDIVVDANAHYITAAQEPVCTVYLQKKCVRHELVRYHLAHNGSPYNEEGGISIELLRILECQIMRGEITVKDRLDFVDD